MNERPDINQIKAQLAAELVQLIDSDDADQRKISAGNDVAKIDIARLRSGDLENISIDDLVALLNAFDRHVAVTISPAAPGELGEELSLADKIAAITAGIPMHEWEKLPTDLAANHDHYLYGALKRD
jgi:predicted XRE-type DNA-binding protein